MHRLRWASLIVIALGITTGATCNRNREADEETSPTATATATAAARIELEGIDTEALTAREHQKFSSQVTSLLAPCPDVAVPLAQCVRENRSCKTCEPGAAFVYRMVRAGLPDAEVAELYEARFDPKKVKTIVAGDSPAKGAEDPAVTLVEFADFECPGCGDFYPLIEQLYGRHGEHMKVVYKHYPLPNHPHAKLAARAAWAAQQQEQFWKMHRMLFSHQDRLTEPDLKSYAEEVGLDLARFEREMHSEAAKKAVEEDKKQGKSLGVAHTPTIFINGRELPSGLPNLPAELGRWIELELELAGVEPSAAPQGPTQGPPAPDDEASSG